MSPQRLKEKLLEQRARAVATSNEALALHGHDVRFDHRSLRERGLTREPERYLGPAKVGALSEDERKALVRRRQELRDTPPAPAP
jgi:hypothetical protein